MRLAVWALSGLLGASGTLASADYADPLLPQARAAIDRSLVFFANSQRSDGSFDGPYGTSTGVVGVVVCALLADGQVPGSNIYGHVTARALRYLLASAQPSGLIHRAKSKGPPMYNHALATLALAEAWGETADPRYRATIQAAVDLICSTQNSAGGWRYQPVVADADVSVTVMQLMALRAARDSGIAVPPDIIAAGIAYVKQCHNPAAAGKDGGFGYTPGGGSGFARTGAGVTSLQVAGDQRSAEVREGVAYLLKHKPLGTADASKHEDYGRYYATMGIYQAQGQGAWGREAWQRWYPAMREDLVRTQKQDGTWTFDEGPLYGTACAALVLTIPCRYLPIYQR